MKNNFYHFVINFLAIAGILCFNCRTGYAQLFPGLEGEDLVTALQNAYTPQQLLDDTQVKDTLYARIFIEEDTVRCIYSDLPRFLPTGVDPSQFLFGSGNEIESINMEHGWPQAKGAGEGTNGNMNMHHLFPSRVSINSDRGNFPYSEINDNTTQKWYYLQQEISNIPDDQIEEYSEFVTGNFEPRESSKGDIARAMFYFWTIYRSDALNADSGFFNLQVDDLCQWHEQDPVDAFEMVRNERISFYQDGKINPFITDCSLARRAYCSQLSNCPMTSVEEDLKNQAKIFYDPVMKQLHILGEENNDWTLYIVDLVGRIVHMEKLVTSQKSTVINIPPGFYIACALNNSAMISTRLYVP